MRNQPRQERQLMVGAHRNEKAFTQGYHQLTAQSASLNLAVSVYLVLSCVLN